QCDYGTVNYGDYRTVNYACKKNVCSAECNEDGSGCGEGNECNTNTCTCLPLSVVCGNGICEENEEVSCPSDCKKSECPYRIDLKLNKNDYYLDDTIKLDITVYDINKNPLPYSKFDLEILLNDVFVGFSTYTTEGTGSLSLTRKISKLVPRGFHKYIAKAKSNIPGCKIVGDEKMMYVYVNATMQQQKINISRYEFIIEKFNVTKESNPKQTCGNNIVDYGETCEGNSICRNSFGCDYKNHIYDFAEQCSSCSCPEDKKSEPNDKYYCSNCYSCGDGSLNCGEDCEGGTINQGPICRFGILYNRIDACLNCKWNDDGVSSDILIDTCECKCAKNPEINCVDGNYIDYTRDYNAGCSDGKCNSCNCVDTYNKDNNKNGIDDKCDTELCANKIDDNDNGLVDEEGCIWYYCSQCGYGLFNFCTRQECSKFKQVCFFNTFGINAFSNFNLTIGSCDECSSINSCEAYKSDDVTCIDDPCSIGNCIYDGRQCCTDNDNDKVCDLNDNCLELYNPNQEDSDKDGKGDACELCINEPLLFEPNEQKELSCEDKIDNDCDGLRDCKDSDCAGIADCCQAVNDCEQSNCTIEECAGNRCDYKIRPLCDNRECPKGSYCDVDGECKEPESSSNVCLYCVDNCIK
ncbi:hypothetical protein HY636_05485, partial [Candidatus Woesearchaeota archaeon]|nr:hypothetical protein [Candidatus Woesearchaeota archaeon]